jgi:hypothetical protein
VASLNARVLDRPPSRYATARQHAIAKIGRRTDRTEPFESILDVHRSPARAEPRAHLLGRIVARGPARHRVIE